MEFFGLKKPLVCASYYETEQRKKLYKELKFLVQAGGIYALTGMVGAGKTTVALFIDEAHDIHGQILTALKRIIEVVDHGGCQLSIILAGHPKLGNSLSKSSIEEIGARTKIFSIDSAMGNLEKYVE